MLEYHLAVGHGIVFVLSLFLSRIRSQILGRRCGSIYGGVRDLLLVVVPMNLSTLVLQSTPLSSRAPKTGLQYTNWSARRKSRDKPANSKIVR